VFREVVLTVMSGLTSKSAQVSGSGQPEYDLDPRLNVPSSASNMYADISLHHNAENDFCDPASSTVHPSSASPPETESLCPGSRDETRDSEELYSMRLRKISFAIIKVLNLSRFRSLVPPYVYDVVSTQAAMYAQLVTREALARKRCVLKRLRLC
jgi:hypothetical protein